MAINYTDTFTKLGTFIAEANLALSRQTSQAMGSGVGADRILDQFNNNREWVTGVLPLFISNWSSYRSLVTGINRLAGEFLVQSLRNELNYAGSASAGLVSRLSEQMRVESQSVKVNACTATKAVVSKVGNGELYVSTLTGYGSETNQGLIPEVVSVVCTDSITSSGAERFSLTGYARTTAEDGHSAPGSGSAPALGSVATSSLLLNGSLDSFTSDLPNGWTLANGAATTNVLKNTTDLHAFTSSLELKSSGVATIRLEQPTTLTNRKVYCISVWLKRSGGAWASGSTLTIKVGGTGWSVNVFSAGPETLSSSAFTSHVVFFSTPDNLPSDVKVTVEWTSATGNVGKSIYVSGLFLSVPVKHAGVHYAVTRGDVPFLIGDSFTCTTTNARDGKFQDWFTRFYGVQLPSSATPTVSDALVP
jgi:hypothetical protein